ncbi:hypothetical protein [Natrialba aegyptia]|uniref:Uncharacterized protein n=1 Tax=Natrialba aegyptia DSM 13077 TaxID=1227491 RepID=M0B8G9_9EURY|nr:hypothetical protein [Natrialba aegyptia]ELZ06802.1 hypothetical protein C480_07212 [Natrialba aegyptia DSM 13077]
MKEIPRQTDYDSTTEWLETVADETDTDFEVLKAVGTQLRPELISLPESDKRDQLQRLLKEHTEFMAEVEGDADAWIDIYFERDGEIDNYYQYLMMSHNLTRVTDEEVEAMKEVNEEEDMDLDVQPEHDFVMGTQLDWEGVEEELRLVRKILNEVYGVGIDDIERAEEQRNGKIISWTEV